MGVIRVIRGSLCLLNEFFTQNSNAREIPIALVVVEPVTDDEFVLDFKAEIIGVHRAVARFLFTEEHTDFHAERSGGFELLANGRERVTAIEDVVENQNMSIFYVRRRDLFENDFAAGLRFSVVTGETQAIELQRERNSQLQI